LEGVARWTSASGAEKSANAVKKAAAAPGPARHEFSPPYALGEVPTTAAAIYVDDIFVPLEESLATAAHLGDLRPWISNEFQHNGIREDGATILGRLFALIDDH